MVETKGSHKSQAVTVPESERGKNLQESDLMEFLPKGELKDDELTKNVQLVSLGCMCAPKLSFQRIGRGAATLPFDWSRTKLSGILHFMRNDFAGFFDWVTRAEVPESKMVMYRSFYHSFWHDDPREESMRERYRRRILRFNELDASQQPVLFVRAAASTEEVGSVQELLDELRHRFGPLASLLLILDFQRTVVGPATVEGLPNLLVYFASADSQDDSVGPYADCINLALDWVVGRGIDCRHFDTLERIGECASETHWGYAYCGQDCFEPEPPLRWSSIETPGDQADAQSAVADFVPPTWLLPGETPVESDMLETSDRPPAVPDDGIVLVSLGCDHGPKRTFQALGRGYEALPFDWIRTSYDGIMEFLGPEAENFFECTTSLPVPGVETMTMYRHRFHSFWHDDDPRNESTRTKYRRRFDNLHALAHGPSSLLFVRAVATTEEIGRAPDLLRIIHARFPGSGLLLLVDDQYYADGAFVVETCRDVLVYFIKPAESKTIIAYRRAIQSALKWMRGREFSAGLAPNFEAMQNFTTESHWGYKGFGELDAFEALNTDCLFQDMASPSKKEETELRPLEDTHPEAQSS